MIHIKKTAKELCQVIYSKTFGRRCYYLPAPRIFAQDIYLAEANIKEMEEKVDSPFSYVHQIPLILFQLPSLELLKLHT